MSIAPATASDTASRPTTEEVGRERTPWLLLTFIAVLLFLPSVVVFPGPLRSNGSPAVLLSFTMFGLMVLLFLHRSGRGVPLAVNAGFAALVIYLVANLVTYAAGQHRVLTVDIEASTTRSLLSLLGNVGVALYVAQHVTTSRHRRLVTGVVLAGMAFSSVVAISQAFSGPVLRYLLQPPGFVLNRDRSTGLRDGFVRVIGTADHPIEFAVLASAAVPLALHLARYGASVWSRRASGLALVVLLVAIPASVSRSAVIAVAAALLVYAFALTGRGVVNAVVALAAALGVYAVVSPRLFGAFVDLFANASSDDSITGRTDDYAAVDELFHRYPVFGGGLGTNPTNGGRLLDNQWLSALVEGGVVGVAALALLFTAAFAGIVRLRRRARSPRDRSEVFAIGAAFAGIFVCNLTFDLLAYTQATFVLFILFGMLWGARDDDLSQDPEQKRRLT